VADRGEDGDLRAELVTLRARVEEQTALAKRTADALRRLAESLVSRKRSYERLLSLNSFAAYALFTILLGGGFFLLYQSRVGDLVDAERAAVQARDRARERAQVLQEALDGRRAAAESARAFFEHVEAGDARRILALYPQLDRDALTPTERAVFDAAAKDARAEIARERHEVGLEAYRRGDYGAATAELLSSLSLEHDARRAAVIRYYLGVAQLELAQHEEAARTLELALVGGVEREGLSDARYHAAAALEALGERERARASYERFASEHPASSRAWQARQRAAELSREP
jgi:TolA-binding protein